jgi:acyl dehydratase
MDCIDKTYDEIKVGDSAELSRVLTKHDIQLFAVMSGDVNPAHLDEEYAKSAMFHEIIAHGMWGGSLISTVIGTQLPGPGTIYLEQSLKFTKPLGIGDTVNITVTVKEKQPNHRVVLDCLCSDQDGDAVISGQALVIAPTEKVRRERIPLPKIEFKTSLRT